MLGWIDHLASWWLDWRTQQHVRRIAPELDELGLEYTRAVPGGWEATFVTEAAVLIANDMAALLDQAQAENYVTFDFMPRIDRAKRPVRATVQWARGKSPGVLVEELKARIAELEQQVVNE